MTFLFETVTPPRNEVHLISSKQFIQENVCSRHRILCNTVRFVQSFFGQSFSICTKFTSEQFPSKRRQTMVTSRQSFLGRQKRENYKLKLFQLNFCFNNETN